jgi:uncharacterized membrane protein YraQ (UPF0718 family)
MCYSIYRMASLGNLASARSIGENQRIQDGVCMSSSRVPHLRRALFAFSMAAALAGYFWSQSRVPALQQKAAMGGRTRMGNLGFEVLFPQGTDRSFFDAVWQTSIEWAVTNWRGMTFGVLFAAIIMTLVSCFPRRTAAGGGVVGALRAALQGLAAGAPLGLCANCATPVAHGMQVAGMRTEASLATIIASPTLNPVVLGMVFAMFPLHIAGVKVALTLALVLIVMPLLVRFLPTPAVTPPAEDAALTGWTRLTHIFFRPPPAVECPLPGAPAEPWAQAAWQALRLSVLHLVYVLRATVPLMALAGILGALLVQLAPLESLAEASDTPLVLAGVALFGALLPVPMSFDVLMASMLFAAGAPLTVAGTLLFTLGTFSVYPFLVVWRSLRPALAVALMLTIAALGLGAGVASQLLQKHATASALDFYAAADARRGGQELLTFAREACGRLGPDAAQCLESVARRGLAQGMDASICLLVPSAGQTDCQEAARFEATTRAAIQSGHLELCLSHTTPKDRGQCQRLVVDAVTRDNPDVSICDELVNSEEIANCKMHALRAWVEPRGDGTLCSVLGEADAEAQCRDFARTCATALQRSPEACQGLDDEQRGQFCLDRVATLLVDDAIARDDSAAGCASIPEQLQEACRNRSAHKWSMAHGDPALCDSIKEPEGRTTCARGAVVERVLAEFRSRRAADAGIAFALAPPSAEPDAVQPSTPAPAPLVQETLMTGGVRMRRTAFSAANTDGEARFVRHLGPDLGLTGLPRFTGLDFREPFVNGRGVASGDFDDDGRPDLLLATRVGPRLFRNLGGLRFAPVALPKVVQDADTFLVAFVDVDDDGRLDIFFSAYGADVRVLLNDGGHYDRGRMQSFPHRDAVVALAAAFADTNRDGRLDVYLGNWSFGSERGFEPTYSRNRMLVSFGGGHVEQVLPEAAGETLSTLFTDFNGDRSLDLIVGNDYDRPDHFYFGSGDGSFVLVGRGAGVIPVTPMHTMSIDAGDIDNDLIPDIFMADMSFGPATPGIYCDPLTGEDAVRCRATVAAFEAFESARMADCGALPEGADAADTQGCMAAVLTQLAFQSRDKAICGRLPEGAVTLRKFCELVLDAPPAPPLPLGDWLDQQTTNKLLLGNGVGRFADVTKRLGVEKSGWTWTARFADLDDDGFQDIYAGNGYKFLRPTPNVFFRNIDRATRFEDQAAKVGLDERLNTPAFTPTDLDGDGDLDLVLTTVPGPVIIYENRLSRGRRFHVELRDHRGNRFGVGSKVRIELDVPGRPRQMREIRAGGGYLSFDAPIAHFGVGDVERIKAIEVEWSTGQADRYEGPFDAGHRYVIERPAAP